MSQSKDKEKSNAQTKEITFLPLINNLLKPSADMLGEEIRDYLKEKIDRVKRDKQEKNLAEHLKKASHLVDEVGIGEDDYDHLCLLEEWIKGAENVDPKNHILSEMWQKLLADILSGKSIESTLIEKLKKIDMWDAALLLHLSNKTKFPKHLLPITKEERNLKCKKLTELGLITTDQKKIFNMFMAFAGSGVIGMGSFTGVTEGWAVFDGIEKASAWVSLFTLVVMLILVILLVRLLLIQPLKITWIGTKLLEYVPKKL